MMPLSFDELNVLANKNDKRNIDIDRYFDEMELPEGNKEVRKEFAKRFSDELFVALALLFIFLQYQTTTGVETVKRTVERSLLNAINTFTHANSELTEFASQYAEQFVDVTVENAEKYKLFDESVENNQKNLRKAAYFFSEIRAKFNAADTANSVFNYDEFREAVEDGKKYKQWVTMKDERVRMTHAEVDGTILPINELFHVGRATMRYPHDWDMAETFPEELINCRCQIRYLTKEQFNDIAKGL